MAKDEMSVSQRKYIIDILQETGMLRCKSVATPVEPVHKPREL